MEAAVAAAWKRRDRGIATRTIVFCVIAAAATLVLLTQAHNHSSRVSSTSPAQASTRRARGHLVFGMTPQQVLRRTGHPVTTEGTCWLFSPTKSGIVGSISVQPPWSGLPYDPRTQGGLELCFAGGHYANGYQHMFDPRKQRWVWFAWPLTLMHGSTDYSDGV